MTNGSIVVSDVPRTQRDRNWLLQILWGFLDLLDGDVSDGSGLQRTLRFVIALVSASAVVYSTAVFVSASANGIIMLSPALAVTFVSGIVGFGVARATASDENEDLQS